MSDPMHFGETVIPPSTALKIHFLLKKASI